MTVTQAPPRPPVRPQPPVVPSLPVESHRGQLGGIAVGQIVALEIVVIMATAALVGPMWMRVSGGAVACLLLLAIFARRDGRWWYESVWLRRRFRQRAQAAVRAATGPAGTVGGPAVVEAIDRRNRFGVGQDEDGFFVTLEVMPWRDGDGYRAGMLPLDQLAELLATTAVPLSALQVVIHSVPAPTAVLDWRAPCTNSYREMLGPARVPAEERVWVTGRLSPRDAQVAAAARGGGVTGVHRALAAAVGRLDKTLRAAGTPARVLGAAELSAAVAMVTGAPLSLVERARFGKEEWRAWRTTDEAHVSFELSDLPRLPLPQLVAQLSQQKLMSVTVSIVLTPHMEEEVSIAALLRVSVLPDAIEQTVGQVVELCQQAGARLRRLDGEHGPAVYAAAPTGGGAS